MSDMQNEMNAAVTKFVGEITEIAKQAARDQLDVALGGLGGLGGGSRNSRNSRSTGSSMGARGKGVKRDPGDIEKIGAKFHAFVKSNPGMRIEQINTQLGTTTKDLRLPIKKLIADGEIKMKGQKRSATYH